MLSYHHEKGDKIMSCLQNEILLENLYEEGLDVAEKQGLVAVEAEAFAEKYAYQKFEERA